VYPDKSGYRISTDPSELDLGVVHGYLKESYWAAGVPEDVVRRSIKNSLCFGVYRYAEQVGFARVITDRATFAYLADVFVLEAHRGRGIGKWLVIAGCNDVGSSSLAQSNARLTVFLIFLRRSF
jgi:GNAT superfamily N-acetyltransferase